MTIEIRLLDAGDAAVLDNVAEDVFDYDIGPDMAQQRFLESPSHYIAVAIEDGTVVGMATANEYLHPDKPVMIWVNEMGVATSHRRRGIGKQLLTRILDMAEDHGGICVGSVRKSTMCPPALLQVRRRRGRVVRHVHGKDKEKNK